MTTQQDWLSSYFGDDVAEDLEKTAQAQLLVKIAEANNLDINSLSEQELQALAAELIAELEGGQQAGAPGAAPGGPQPGMPGIPPQGAGLPGGPGGMGAPGGAPNPLAAMAQRPAPQGQPAPQPSPMSSAPAAAPGDQMAKEAAAKFEEADALGRVMAHSYVDELDKIAAARELEKTAGRFGAAASKAKDVAGRAANFAKKNKGAVGAGAGGAAAGFAAGRASKKEKTASPAFEKLATDRAVEILQTLGIDPETGNQIGAPGPEADQGQAQDANLGQAVDQRALQMLAETYGFDPAQVAAAYDQQVGGGEVPQQ